MLIFRLKWNGAKPLQGDEDNIPWAVRLSSSPAVQVIV